MTTIFLMFWGLGEFIESNPMVLVPIVLLIASLATLGYIARSTRKDVDDLTTQLNGHIQNQDAHVNQLYIGTLKDRLTNVENEVKSVRSEMQANHKEIGEKIDKRFDQLSARLMSK